MLCMLFSSVNVSKFCFNVTHVETILQLLEILRNTKQETEVFNCEKCKNEFPGIGSLKKHLRKVHEVWDPAIEENSKGAVLK